MYGLTTSFVAGGTIEPGRFVRLSTPQPAGKSHEVVQAAVGEKPIGISAIGSYEAPLPGNATAAAVAGQQLPVIGLGCIAELQVSVAVAAGDYLVPTANGRGSITAVLGAQVFARAIEDASADTFCKVLVIDTQIGT
jgi:hypothetical protein